MMPLDDPPPTEDDVRSDVHDPPTEDGVATSRRPDGDPPVLDDIWSSIGPGRVPDRGEGPPTIRPSDFVAPAPVPPTPITTTVPPLEKDLPVTDPTPTPSASDLPAATPTDPALTADALREELRIGVRMLQALDAQFKRAETLIQREEEAARRVDESIERLSRRFESLETGTAVSTTIDADEIERTATDAVARITTAADDAARQLHDRLERFVALDSRLDELDATLRTVERRLERLPESAPAGRPTTPVAASASTASTTSSGTLSIEPRIAPSPPASASSAATTGPALDGSNPEVATAIRLQLLVDRGEEVRRELRSDLEAICTASASLVEIVERASETERTLRGTLEADAARPIAGATDDDRAAAGWSIASILRRLADEFDANESATTSTPPTASAPAAALVARSITSIAPSTPVELDVSHGDGHPVRREPLAAPDVTIDPVAATRA